MDKKAIINEIKRTAQANGGVPLGQSRFHQQTGIRVSDWQGKLWIRWGDALREAGFDPNQMRSGYDKTMLIEKFIALMRELGHFPVHNELRLKAHQDPAFPSHNTFSRLGSKQQIAATIRDYCRERVECDDLLALCAPILNDAPDQPDGRAKSKDEINGFVYMVKSGRYYKIGSTNAVGRRAYELAIQLPEKVKVVHEIPTDDPVGIETYWHTRFASRRKRGEWFELNGDDVRAFRRRKFM